MARSNPEVHFIYFEEEVPSKAKDIIKDNFENVRNAVGENENWEGFKTGDEVTFDTTETIVYSEVIQRNSQGQTTLYKYYICPKQLDTDQVNIDKLRD